MPKPPAVEDLPPFQYCMYNKNQMIYASSHRFFQHYSIIPDTLIHCGDPVINHTLVASLENCASFVPSYFIGRIPSDTLRKLIFYAIDVPELSWELRVLYRRDSALGIFAREMIRLVRDALAPLAVNRPRQQKDTRRAEGVPGICVSLHCSQPIKARCAG